MAGGNPISSSYAKLMLAPQTGRGVAATTDILQLPWVGGNITDNPRIVSQATFDGQVFNTERQEVAGYEGSGTLTILCDPVSAPLILSGLLGPDAVTGSSVPYTHVQDTAAPGDGRFFTCWIQVGSGATAVTREYVDVKIAQAKISGNASAQYVELAFDVVCTQPKKNNPLPTTGVTEIDALTSFTFAQGVGQYQVSTVGGSATTGINQFEVTIGRSQTPWQGDGLGAYAVVPGRGAVDVAVTLLADDQSLPLVYNTWYGTPTPAAGASPVAELFYDSFDLMLQNSAGSLAISTAKLGYHVDSTLDPQLDGGAIELPVSGRAVKPASGELLVVTTTNDRATAY